MDWDNLGFGLVPTDYVTNTVRGRLNHYGNIELSPCSAVLNYGQGIFEGMKALRRENCRLYLFRPDQNAICMKMGAERMCMPSPSIDQFIDAVKHTALANYRWIPPPGKGSLYIRSLLLGTGPVLGLAPASEYTFLVYASPEGTAPLNLHVEEEYHPASRGGYSSRLSRPSPTIVLLPCGWSPRITTPSCCGLPYAASSSPTRSSGTPAVILTLATNGTILSRITRKGILEIARGLGYTVEERSISVEELMEADEVFCTGTAVVLSSVGSITYRGNRVEYKTGTHSVSKKLLSTFMGNQAGHIEAKKMIFSRTKSGLRASALLAHRRPSGELEHS
ncbi:hypothetical protein Nepgr_018325 [Nepenthes gracilis]|uniref:Branched-chain-amino-acid transaminase n=1 Tax=Nepenthes gracilis TaxID=150966 RepID=A0AAD3XTX3_NEPGR|nr:hypothetical protein Nepgr_018325 [Nepenthes gracilis]